MINDSFDRLESSARNRISFRGYAFSLDDCIWRLDKDIELNLLFVKRRLDNQKYSSFIKVLSFFAETCSSSHTANILDRYRLLLDFASESPLDVRTIIRYRSTLGESREWYLAVVRVLFKKWEALGLPGLERDVVSLLTSWRLKVNRRGDAIKRSDPNQGALSDIELQSVLEKSAQAYEQGRLDVTGLCVIQLLASSGRRGIQLAALKVKDVKCRQQPDGLCTYHVNYPRAKQRHTGFRAEFREIAIIKDVWDALQVQIKHVLAVVSSCVGAELPEAVGAELPLFVHGSALAGIKGIDALVVANTSDRLHAPSNKMEVILAEAIAICQVYSERTGKLIKLTPRRFRYTLGTRAAREGCGIHVIAELLDHSDTQAAHVYTENVPEYAARIDEAVSQHLTHYAQAFAGVDVSCLCEIGRAHV